MNTLKIIHLPRGFWALEVNGERSRPAPYEHVIFFKDYVAHTCYYDNEAVFPLLPKVNHETLDHSLGE